MDAQTPKPKRLDGVLLGYETPSAPSAPPSVVGPDRRRRRSRASSIYGGRRCSVELGENVTTCVRLRPWLPHERAQGVELCVKIEPPHRVVLVDPTSFDRSFDCDFAFDSSDPASGQYTSQESIYGTVGAKMVDDALQGHNGCLLAYGQTGTGKTHTVMGNFSRKEERGLLPRIAMGLFSKLEQLSAAGATISVKASYIEIYNNRLRDLLAKVSSASRSRIPTMDSLPPPTSGAMSARAPPRERSSSSPVSRPRTAPAPRDDQQLKIHTHPAIGVYVENLTDHRVLGPEELVKLVTVGERTRHTATTSMNSKSSRSHTIFSIKVEIHHNTEEGGSGNRMATLQVVDLAGRENEQTSECTGERLRELTFINRSLFQLANCVHALSKPEDEHVPFRNSKLTLLLSETFTRNSRTVLLAALTPSSFAYDDNLLTCRFLESTGRITTFPVQNRFSSQELKGKIQEELDQMRRALGLGGADPTVVLDAKSDLDLRCREALLRLVEQQDSPVNGKRHLDAKQAVLIDACAHVSTSLNTAQKSLDTLDQANAFINDSLGKAESCLSAVETRLQQVRGLDTTRQKKDSAGTVKLPPLVRKVPISFSVEMPQLIEIRVGAGLIR